jgi:hypothetical protein
VSSQKKVVKTENKQKESAWLNLEKGLTMRILLGSSEIIGFGKIQQYQ